MKNNQTTQAEPKKYVSFAAIDPYVEVNIISPKETVSQNRDFVNWGDGNIYPDYLFDLYGSATTLSTIINGNIDYVAGDAVEILPLGDRFAQGIMNRKGDTIEEVVRDLAKDYYLFGGFALQIIRDHNGDVAEFYYLDMRYIRCNKDCNVFYYSESWNRGGRKNVTTYPAFMPSLDWGALSDDERNRHASSVLYVKNVRSSTYPTPIFAAAVKDCEIERGIEDYHLNNLENGFTSSMVVNFNNGEPSQEIKEEIEEAFNEKFSGHQNAGRIMFSWNKDRMSATTFDAVKAEDFSAKYQALSEHSRRQIFASFRAMPLLFGLTSEANTGFSTDEFEQCFKLYNRTQIRPAQRKIADAFDKIYGSKGVLTITPFSLAETSEKEVN